MNHFGIFVLHPRAIPQNPKKPWSCDLKHGSSAGLDPGVIPIDIFLSRSNVSVFLPPEAR